MDLSNIGQPFEQPVDWSMWNPFLQPFIGQPNMENMYGPQFQIPNMPVMGNQMMFPQYGDNGSDSGNETCSPDGLNSLQHTPLISPQYPPPQSSFAIHNLLAAPHIPKPAANMMIPTDFGAYYNQMMTIPPMSELCTVCETVASGKHYGAITCEGCKSFYRRSMTKKLSYTCLEQNNCQLQSNGIGKKGKYRCQACRLQKCLDVGMTVNHLDHFGSHKRGRVQSSEPKEIVKEVKTQEKVKSSSIEDNKSLVVYESRAHAHENYKKFIRGNHELNALFPTDEFEFNEKLDEIIDGLLWIRAAFSKDLVLFHGGADRWETIAKLRNGVENYNLSSAELGFLTAITIVNATKSTNNMLLSKYINDLTAHLKVSHPEEPSVCVRICINICHVINK